MKRRDFISLLGGAAAAWPLAARGQQIQQPRRIGVLMGVAEDADGKARVQALLDGLRELGWTEGRNLQLINRFAAGDPARLLAYAAELAELAPDLIVANTSPVLAALQRATTSVPIVFAAVNDPVAQGFVQSLARPGGKITGFTQIEFSMIGKWLDLLRDLVPGISRVAVIFNPATSTFYKSYMSSFEAARPPSPIKLVPILVHSTQDIEGALEQLGRETGGGAIVPPDTFTIVNRGAIIIAAQQHRVPTIFNYTAYVKEGALIAYGADVNDIFRRSASYVDRVLKGADPGSLPVQQPIKFQLAINLTTAKALGLSVSPMLLARADEVIE